LITEKHEEAHSQVLAEYEERIQNKDIDSEQEQEDGDK
jgi:hypothetical protein